MCDFLQNRIDISRVPLLVKRACDPADWQIHVDGSTRDKFKYIFVVL